MRLLNMAEYCSKCSPFKRRRKYDIDLFTIALETKRGISYFSAHLDSLIFSYYNEIICEAYESQITFPVLFDILATPPVLRYKTPFHFNQIPFATCLWHYYIHCSVFKTALNP